MILYKIFSFKSIFERLKKMVNRIKIEVLGTTYTITTPEEEQYVRALAKEVDSQVRQLVDQNPKMSPSAALIICALSSMDSYKKSEKSADHLRAQLSDYLEDATRARIELDDAKREVEKLRRQLALHQSPTH